MQLYEAIKIKAEGQTGIHKQEVARKRRQTTAGSDFQALLTEQRLLRETFEAYHAREVELRKRLLACQEKLTNMPCPNIQIF